MLIKSHQEFKFLKKIIKDVLGINVEKNKSRLREVVITTSELTIEEIKNEIISLRVENKSLHSTISNLEEENKNLQKEKDIFGRQERMTEIFEVVRQRTKIGTEDKLLKKLNIFYNGVY